MTMGVQWAPDHDILDASTVNFSDFLRGQRVFTVADVDRYLVQFGAAGVGPRHRLLEAHRIAGDVIRIRRGLYATVSRSESRSCAVDPFVVASRLADDAVLAYRSALELHGAVTARRGQCTYLTSQTAPPREPVWRGTVLRAVSHPTPLVRARTPFYGTMEVPCDGTVVRVTTRERTFVDVLNRPRLVGTWEEITGALVGMSHLDVDAVVDYVERLHNRTAAAKVGWVLERHTIGLAVPDTVFRRLEALRPRGPHYLERLARKRGRYLARWNLVVPEEHQTGSRLAALNSEVTG